MALTSEGWEITTVRAMARAPGRTRNSPGNTMNEIRRKSFTQSDDRADRTRKRHRAIVELQVPGAAQTAPQEPGADIRAARMISASSRVQECCAEGSGRLLLR